MTVGYPVVQHVLGNGLRVVVSEDHASPSATVYLAYDVGSRDEAPGRTGLAHLFEHLMMSSGSRNAGPGEPQRPHQRLPRTPPRSNDQAPDRPDTWEVREPGKPRTLHPWAASMMDDLERRYDDKGSSA